MVTIAQAIYYTTDNINYLVGVAGLDSPVQIWKELGFSNDEIQRRLRNTN